MELSHATYQALLPHQIVSTTGEILASPAGATPDKIGLIDGSRQWTFKELDQLANQFAQALLEKFGEGHSERMGPVGIIGKNSAEYFIAHFGISRTGTYSINFATRCSVDDLTYTINLTKPSALIVDEDCLEIVEAARAQFEHQPLYISIGQQGVNPSIEFWDFFQGQANTQPAIEIKPEDNDTIIFTGGTTGKPKATLSSHLARAVSAMAGIEDFRVATDLVAGYSVPFTHTAGLCSWLQPAVLAGCTGVIIPKWDPEIFMQLAEQHRINMIFAVPSQMAVLLDHPTFEPERLKSIERIIFGGAPLARAIIERAEEAMPWMYCGRAYGSTETGHLAAQIKRDREAVYDAYNQPGGRIEIEIFKAPGVIAEIGETGEVATRGPHLMTGYLNDEKSEAGFFKSQETDGEWGWMGDLAVKHDGYFSINGRSKHMIISGGLNIYPAELEEVLSCYPGLKDCVVFGVEDPTWGETPVAAVVPKGDSIDGDDIMAFVAEKVAGYKQLRKIFVIEEISRTAAGKARIDEIRKQCLG